MRFLTIVLLFSFLISFGQEYSNVKELTPQLYSETDNDSIKTLKICEWIIENIEFNTKAFKEQSLLTNKEIITEKIATNQGYCNLFSEMLNCANIKNAIITGYYKGIFYEKNDAFLKANHQWNAAFIDKEWQLFDITLASGYLVNTNPTNADKEKLKAVKSHNKDMLFVYPIIFRRTHMPLQKYWQLSDRPITVSEFENCKNLALDKTKYNFIDEINNNYEKKSNLKQDFKFLTQGYQENERNVLLLAEKSKKLAKKEFKKIKRGSVSEEAEYKKSISQIAKLCKQSSTQYGAYTRMLKQENQKKLSKNKTFNLSNNKTLNKNIRTVKRDISERNKKIDLLSRQNKLYSDLIEQYKKKIIEQDKKIEINETEIEKTPNLNSIHNDLNVILSYIKDISTNTIKKQINNIIEIEDSINTLITYKLEYEHLKTNFLSNFGWNNIDIFNKTNDTIVETTRRIQEQIELLNSKVDTSYFNNIKLIKMLVVDAENKYNLMTGEKMSDNIFMLFNQTMNDVYNSANNILIVNNQSLDNLGKYLEKDYNNNNKKILDEINEQVKAEDKRVNEINNYYNELMKQELELYNSAIEKCNTRISIPFDKYRKEGIEKLDVIDFIYIE
jgi:hypothetical protein